MRRVLAVLSIAAGVGAVVLAFHVSPQPAPAEPIGSQIGTIVFLTYPPIQILPAPIVPPPPPPQPHLHTAVPIEPTSPPPPPPPPTDTPTATSTPTLTPRITPTATPAEPAATDSQGDGGFPWLPVLGGFAVRRGKGFRVPWRKRP